jgi:hypothetical protein
MNIEKIKEVIGYSLLAIYLGLAVMLVSGLLLAANIYIWGNILK